MRPGAWRPQTPFGVRCVSQERLAEARAIQNRLGMLGDGAREDAA